MAFNEAGVIPLRSTRWCPMCGQLSDRRLYPFCSQRCADRDLNRWLSGAYSFPEAVADHDDDDAAGDVGDSE